ncbi:MAG: DUF2723 domain-containing protein, partial [Chloroflexi bacterium]|nr:DUF2723 domain-containing protein [Chloroflexota bacterium]
MPSRLWERETDVSLALLLGVAALILYTATLAPSVATLFDDSLEFQLVCLEPGIAHPTGYPLYTLLGHAFTRLPLGDVARRVNLLSAVAASACLALVYGLGRALSLRRTGALAAAVALGLSPVFWSQATIAEVYALHCLFMAAVFVLAVRWARSGDAWALRSRAVGVALVVGLSLTHHRMTLLSLPALGVYAATTLLTYRSTRGRWLSRRHAPSFWNTALAFVAAAALPLALYAYLPWRAQVTTSLDGSYVHTWQGFWAWVTASSYTVFFGENPLARSYDAAFYWSLFKEQFSVVGLALAGLGLVNLLLRRPKEWLLVAVALAIQLAFALRYRVGDVEVFFLPAFLLMALLVGAGVSAGPDLGQALRERGFGRGAIAVGRVLALAALGWLIYTGIGHYQAMDRSQDWGVYDYGLDVLTQPLGVKPVLIGILGETTLVRYFQQAVGLGRELHTVAADAEPDRLAAIDAALEAGQSVYLTRELPCREAFTLCAPARYSLRAVGPLVRVYPKGQGPTIVPPQRLDAPLGPAVRLDGYEIATRQWHGAPVVRATLYWGVQQPPPANYKVSARLLDGAGQTLA